MAISPEQIEYMIREAMPDALIKVEGDGRYFFADIIYAGFEGKRLLVRHRMIMDLDTIKTRIQEDEIHALSIRTALTPTEWQEQQKEQSNNG